MKIFLTFILLLTAGCINVFKGEIEIAQNLCKDHGGIVAFRPASFPDYAIEVYCLDKIEIKKYLTPSEMRIGQ